MYTNKCVVCVVHMAAYMHAPTLRHIHTHICKCVLCAPIGAASTCLTANSLRHFHQKRLTAIISKQIN